MPAGHYFLVSPSTFSGESAESRYGAGALDSGGIAKTTVQCEGLASWETVLDMLLSVADGPMF